MKFPAIILISALLVSCEEKAQEPPPAPPAAPAATPDEPEIEADALHTYSEEEKAALAAKASGVEKLLRTHAYDYDGSQNEAAWSDDEFFRHYAEALSHDMEAFVRETLLDDYIIGQQGKETIEADVAACRRSITQLVGAAKAAYTASAAWFEEDIKVLAETDDTTMYVQQFRHLLRQRLLRDLFILSQSSQLRWCSGIAENPDLGSVVNLPLPDLEAGIQNRCWMEQADSEGEANSVISQRLDDHIRAGREIIRKYAYRGTMEANIKLLEHAEAAWDAYRAAIGTAHTPSDNSYTTGSGTGLFLSRFDISMQLSHIRYLSHLIPLTNGGKQEYPESIDFTQFEDTPEAAEARSRRPG